MELSVDVTSIQLICINLATVKYDPLNESFEDFQDTTTIPKRRSSRSSCSAFETRLARMARVLWQKSENGSSSFSGGFKHFENSEQGLTPKLPPN